MSFSIPLIATALALIAYFAFAIGMLLFKSRDAAAQSKVEAQKLLAKANREVRKNPRRASGSRCKSDMSESPALHHF